MPLTPPHSLIIPPVTLIVFKRVTAKQTNVRTCRFCIICISGTPKLLQVACNILCPQGPWAQRAHGYFNLWGMGACIEFETRICCIFLFVEMHYVSSVQVFIFYLCRPCAYLVCSPWAASWRTFWYAGFP